MDEAIRMLNAHIEYAENTNKLHDVGNFEYIKKVLENSIEVSKVEELIEDLKSKPFVDVRYLEVAKVQQLIDEAKQ